MKNSIRPILTIGIIFKNEIGCLQRCLSSLASLRKIIPCELIMADTGSTDGSHEIAARYADILFNFPWINDFSAARNAIMDKASGQWHMYIDADEWLDDDISELAEFLRNSEKFSENLCALTIRNYETPELDSRYSDFTAIRLMRMSLGARFHGAIHEAWNVKEADLQNIRFISQTMLHHDGYVGLEKEQGRAKRERNLQLLRQEISEHPKDLKTLLQYIESAKNQPEYLDIIYQACAAVESKQPYWENLGAPIFRYAVRVALEEGLPEFKEWVSRSETWFPNSPFTRIDVEYMAFIYDMRHENYPESIRRGEQFLKAVDEFQWNKKLHAELAYSTLMMGSPYWEQDVKIYLSAIYIKVKKIEQAQYLLQSINYTLLDDEHTKTLLLILGDFHRTSYADTSQILKSLYTEINKNILSNGVLDKRQKAFYETAALAFLSSNRIAEQQEKDFCRFSYTLFLSLGTESEFGIAAMILETKDKEKIHQLLLEIQDWEQLPVEALAHALACEITFPLPEKTITLEEVNRLIERLAKDRETFFFIIKHIIEHNIDGNLQQLVWKQRLIHSAVRMYEWEIAESGEGLKLIRLFAKAESKMLPRYYASDLLCVENISVLPALHRFGWYCAKAFDALDSGNTSEYIQELKNGLGVCPEAKEIVEYLLEHTPQLKTSQTKANKELLSLAAQVKSLLDAYPPGHPAVATIKESPAYQKVVELIEGMN